MPARTLYLEIVAGMLLSAAGAFALLTTRIVTDDGLLLMLEHVVMFPALFVATVRCEPASSPPPTALANGPATGEERPCRAGAAQVERR
ncbi:MAG: hypothetical protein JXA83_15805 [Acidimicrobiales bacterium]|nr:hypothetical protein [Acidimicrobiales bacterium]